VASRLESPKVLVVDGMRKRPGEIPWRLRASARTP
jgi:hypothetical protein